MTILTVDEALLATLRRATGPAEVRDAAGNLVGFFTPAHARPSYPTTRATEADLPELDRRRATEQGGKTLREIFEHLKTLTTDPSTLADLEQRIQELAEAE
jgi:hypothetical protein